MKKQRSKFGPSEKVKCKNCDKIMQRKTVPAHYRRIHPTYLAENGIPPKAKSYDLLVNKVNNDIDEDDIQKVHAAWDTNELEIKRGPVMEMRFKRKTFQKKNPKKNETQTFLVEVRHARKMEVFTKWGQRASSRKGRNHTEKTRKKALKFLLYATALDAAENMDTPDTCFICQDTLVKEAEDYAAFYTAEGEDENLIVKPCNDRLLHAVHGSCYAEMINSRTMPDNCPYCQTPGFFL